MTYFFGINIWECSCLFPTQMLVATLCGPCLQPLSLCPRWEGHQLGWPGYEQHPSSAPAELRPGSELLMPPGDHACPGHSGYQHPDCLQWACAPSSCHYWCTNLTPAAHLPGVCWRSGAFSVEQNGRQFWNHKPPSLPTCFPPSVWELPVHLVSITEWRMSMCFLPHPALNLWGQFILTSHTSCPCLQGCDPCFSHILAQCWHLSSHFTPWILLERSWSPNRGAWITDNKITSIQKFVHRGEMTHSEQSLSSWVSHRSWAERSHMAPIRGEAANEPWGALSCDHPCNPVL